VKKENEISGFAQLGKLMTALGNEENWAGFSIGATEIEYQKLQGIIGKQFVLNGWFTKENVLQSLKALGNQLTEENLNQWTSKYSYSSIPKRIGVIMAGNIPLVGFHDFLCVLLSGNTVVTKLSSDDNTLLPALAEQLIQYAPSLKERIHFSFGKLGEIDAIIATGSDNSTKYFEQYFGHYPHLFRKNRTSIAVLTGNETKEELTALGKDIFSYFGLGCRNVSHLLVPNGFDLNRFFEAIVDYHPIVNHHKYANNYDYNKAVYLMNLMELLDNNFMLLRESEELFSPLSMVHYQYYSSQEEINQYLEKNKENLQAIVGQQFIPFGEAQAPKLDDYADGVDVMNWLNKLNN
jgi:hypothetical protein